MTRPTRLPRAFALGLTAAVVVSVASVESESEAQLRVTPPQTFTVSTNVRAACSFNATDLTFATHAVGQVSPSYAQTNWTITCPAAQSNAPATTVPVRFTMTSAQGDLAMRSGPNILPYDLCHDAACTQTYPYGALGPVVSVNTSPFTYTLYGRIMPNQPVKRGTYTQVIKVTMTY